MDDRLVKEQAEEVARELAAWNNAFEEGEYGLLVVETDRLLTVAEILWLEHRLDGEAFYLTAPIEQEGGEIAIEFQKGVFALPMVATVLGGMGILVLGWFLYKKPEVAFRLIFPFGFAALGLGIMALSGGRWPGMVAGGGAVAFGGYLAWREVRPIPEDIRNVKAIDKPILEVKGG